MNVRKWFAVVSLMGLTVSAGAADKSKEAIQNLITEYGVVYNERDTGKLAALWVEDGDIIDSSGRIGEGRRQVSEVLEVEISSVPKNVATSFSIGSIRFINQDVAVVTVNRSRLAPAGSQNLTNRGPVTLIDTFVLEKREDKWAIVSLRSVGSGIKKVILAPGVPQPKTPDESRQGPPTPLPSVEALFPEIPQGAAPVQSTAPAQDTPRSPVPEKR